MNKENAPNWLFLKERRKELNLTVEQIAEALSVDKGTVSRWENGKIDNMRRDKIAKLAEILKISPLVILGMEPKEKQKPLTAREFLRILCQGDEKALAVVDRLKLTDNGKLEITGADLHSQAILDYQVQTFLMALKSAKLEEDGLLHFEFPN